MISTRPTAAEDPGGAYAAGFEIAGCPIGAEHFALIAGPCAVDVERVAEVPDVLQIGSRNTQNYVLLAEAGRSGRPVLVKRGPSSTLDELRVAA
jgi:hypothetical protein